MWKIKFINTLKKKYDLTLKCIWFTAPPPYYEKFTYASSHPGTGLKGAFNRSSDIKKNEQPWISRHSPPHSCQKTNHSRWLEANCVIYVDGRYFFLNELVHACLHDKTSFFPTFRQKILGTLESVDSPSVIKLKFFEGIVSRHERKNCRDSTIKISVFFCFSSPSPRPESHLNRHLD